LFESVKVKELAVTLNLNNKGKYLKEHRINEAIRGREVFLIVENGAPLRMPVYAALNRARNENLDLVEMSDRDGLALCKLMDYGKFKYEQQKKMAEQRKNQPKVVVKEIRLSPRIDKHDIEIKLNQVKKFLEENCKVNISVQFRGRENSYKENGFKILQEFNIPGATITPPRSEGNTISITLVKAATV
jgi:translation initiation factor IF-3